MPEKSPLVFQGLVLLEKNTVKQLSFKQFSLWKRSWLFSDSQSCQQSSRVANYAVVFRAVLFLFVASCRPCAIFHERNIFMPHQHYWIFLDMIIFLKIIGRRCRSFCIKHSLYSRHSLCLGYCVYNFVVKPKKSHISDIQNQQINWPENMSQRVNFRKKNCLPCTLLGTPLNSTDCSRSCWVPSQQLFGAFDPCNPVSMTPPTLQPSFFSCTERSVASGIFPNKDSSETLCVVLPITSQLSLIGFKEEANATLFSFLFASWTQWPEKIQFYGMTAAVEMISSYHCAMLPLFAEIFQSQVVV